jgi:hypothetical protein
MKLYKKILRWLGFEECGRCLFWVRRREIRKGLCPNCAYLVDQCDKKMGGLW